MTTLEAIDSLKVTDMTTTPTKGIVIKGECYVNGVRVPFYFNPKTDKFTALGLLNEDYGSFGNLGENWTYRIGCAIKKAMK